PYVDVDRPNLAGVGRSELDEGTGDHRVIGGDVAVLVEKVERPNDHDQEDHRDQGGQDQPADQIRLGGGGLSAISVAAGMTTAHHPGGLSHLLFGSRQTCSPESGGPKPAYDR